MYYAFVRIYNINSGTKSTQKNINGYKSGNRLTEILRIEYDDSILKINASRRYIYFWISKLN